MTIAELRDIAEGLAKRATRAIDGKQDSVHRGWIAVEKLQGCAMVTLPLRVWTLDGESETWANIARLATAIVIACDKAEPRCPKSRRD
jgi:hypothetical protein